MNIEDHTPSPPSLERAEEDAPREKLELPTDRLWNVHQAAAYLGRSTSWVYKESSAGRLPKARGLAWGLRFVPEEMIAYARGQLPAAPLQLRPRKG